MKNVVKPKPTAATMVVAVQHSYGLDGIEVCERGVPDAGPGELRIEVIASSVNPMDRHLATGSPGMVRLVEGLRRPKHEVPGREVCGVIDQIGPGVTGFEVGESVFGWSVGAFAEYATAQADRMWIAPMTMTAHECAALPVAGAAALQAVELANVEGARVVVNGASGGVGHYAVQIAKAHGAQWVAGVCSHRNADFVRSLGADEVIEYGSEDFTSRRWDAVIDCVGNRNGSEIRRALVTDGRWVVVGDENMSGLLGPLPRLVGRLIRWRFGSRSCHWFVQGEDVRYLRDLAALVDAGSVRTHLSDVISVDDIRSGYVGIETGRTVGKIAVDVAATRRVDPIDPSGPTGGPS